ncbi:formate dehydrogenase subunit gamma [Calidifontibacillus erzurumensis]|uniref:Cytochrome b/b6 domain-containing protein n=1 Tax=Calidifontibacillus erzurumensis TaxID=2741433 RepID=A0A8J8KDM6_9BACI|nr:cytochrome b/b6 domain-containing protein [Calidifontibacillus erzurumensis]NSL50845.1 cytochrome b/b6 domain-containing protein [Calidifontibacillus erzurumensis]
MNDEKKILRQSLSNRIVHWLTAISIFLLIISGLGQMPLYKRYNITKLPGAEWLGNYFDTLVLHYIAAIMLLFIVFYHIVLHVIRKEFDIWPKRGDLIQSFLIIKAMITKGKEPESDKYLAEQRLAYLFIGANIMLLIITGIIKIVKNIPGFTMPNIVIFWTAHIHNFATFLLIFGIIGHLAAFLFKENRALLPGMFSGYVKESYVKHRHSLWYKKLKEKDEKLKDRSQGRAL